MERTPWFDGSVKPVRHGVYERLYDDGTIFVGADFCLFDGVWRVFSKSVARAYAQSEESSFQHLKWRGLAKPPKGQVR